MEKVRIKARNLLNEVGGTKIPIHLKPIVQYLGINLAFDFLADEISGILDMRSPANPVILINKSHPETRQRFSAAHEIGHFVLDHVKGTFHLDKKILFRKDYLNPEDAKREREANVFATELLMPADLVKSQFQSLKEQSLMEMWNEDEFPSDLASRFKVSLSAMVIRLQELGLIPKV
jgi:Zn-dependent peptidase ImmA (M78 family)